MDPLQTALDSVADAADVDWASLEALVVDDEMRGMLRCLREISSIARAHACADIRAARSLPFTWGPLEARALIAHGAHGDVYRAWDPRLERDVALKLLRDDDGGDESSLAITEGRLLARVRHPNVVTVYGADRIDGQAGVWMEFLEGHTLHEDVERGGALAVPQAIQVGLDVCAGLSAVHAAGLIHRDVKAQNVMRTVDSRTVLMDLGAGHEHTVGSRRLEGTPVYLAPELLNGASASDQSDLYAVGVLLFFVVTGRYPVSAASLEGLRNEFERGHTAQLRSVANIPPAFATIVDRATAINPEDRFESVADLRALLERMRPRPSRRNWLAAAAVLALAVVGGGATWWSSSTRHTTFVARDWLLVAGFENRTGEASLDNTIEYAFERELIESKFVNLVPRERVDDTLRLMRKPVGMPIDRAIGLELSVRDGSIRALLVGRIDKVGSTYTISATVLDVAHQDQPILAASAESGNLDGVLLAARQLSTRIRAGLGDVALGGAGRPQAERVTTQSFEAFRLYSAAMKAVYEVKCDAAIGLLEQSLQADPSFASAHILLAHCLRNIGRPAADFLVPARRALELADDSSEREQFFIRGSYYSMMGQSADAASAYEQMVRLYPDDYWGTNNLVVAYQTTGRIAEAASTAVRLTGLRPNDAYTLLVAANLSMKNGSIDTARAFVARASRLDFESLSPSNYDFLTFFPAFDAWASGDVTEAARIVDALTSTPPNTATSRGADVRLNYIAFFNLALGRLAKAEDAILRLPIGADRDVNLALIAVHRADLAEAHRHLSAQGMLSNNGSLLSWVLIKSDRPEWIPTFISRWEPQVPPSNVEPSLIKLESQFARQSDPRSEDLALFEKTLPQGIGLGTGTHLRHSDRLADALVKARDLPHAARILEDGSRKSAIYNWSGFSGVFWLHLRVRLADVYRQMGRVDDAAHVEEELARLLALADPDFTVSVPKR